MQDILALLALIRVIRAFRPAIVHTHTAKAGMLGRTAALLALGPRPVIVHTYHGHVLRGYFGPLKSGGFRLLERALAKISDRLIGVSSATVEELVGLGIAPRSKFAVVPLGLELEPFLALGSEPEQTFREEIGVEADDVLFAYTGRLVPIKRPDLMLRAVATARSGGAAVRVAVVGDGALRPELENLARELGCSDAIYFLGYRRDMVRIARRQRCRPTHLRQRGHSRGPDRGCRRWSAGDIYQGGRGIRHRDRGRRTYWLQPGDEAAIAAYMAQIAEDPGLRRRMGARAREHVRKRFAADRLLSDIDALYSRLLDPAGPAE